jgi:hypothetical protein
MSSDFPILSQGSDSSAARLKPWALPKRDVTIRGRRVLRISPRRGRWIYGRFTVLHAHKGGRSVLRREARPWTWGWLRTVCGVLVCTPRGSVMVQFRAWS